MIRRPIALAFIALAFATPARADNASCVDAYENGQRARRDRDLVRARTELTRCAQNDCASIIQSDCGDWLREVERAIPTLIVSARWHDGSDIADARFTIDGQAAVQRVDGKPFSLNPGEHRVRVETDSASAEQTVVAIQGEHDRVLRFTLNRPPRPPAKLPEKRPAPEPESASSAGPGPLPYVLVGVSALAFAGFGYFAISGRQDLRDARDECGPNCPEKRLDDVKRKLLVADMLLGVGVVSAGAATYLFISSGRNEEHQPEARISVGGRF